MVPLSTYGVTAITKVVLASEDWAGDEIRNFNTTGSPRCTPRYKAAAVLKSTLAVAKIKKIVRWQRSCQPQQQAR